MFSYHVWTQHVSSDYHYLHLHWNLMLLWIACTFRFDFTVNLMLQRGHWNFLFSWIFAMCLSRLCLCFALKSHCGHGKVLPSWIDLVCSWRCIFFVDSWSQWSHLYFLRDSLSWINWMWFLKLCLDLASKSHCRHLNTSCTVQIQCASLNDFFVLKHDHKICTGKSYHHVWTECAVWGCLFW